jgi:hypothetical protein
VGGAAIVEQFVKKLIFAGVEEIIIGTGHSAGWFQGLPLARGGLDMYAD